MLEIKILVAAPDLTDAINNLARAIGGGAPVIPATSSAQAEISQDIAESEKTTQAVAEPKQETAQPQPVAETPAPVKEAEPTAPAITQEMLSVAGAALVDDGKMDAVIGALNKFGVQAITQLPKEKFNAFADELRALGADI